MVVAPLILTLLAQTTTPTTTQAINTLQFTFNSDTSAIRIGVNSCGQTLGIAWTSTINGLACTPLSFWTTNASSCGTAPGSGDKAYTDVAQSTLITTRAGTVDVVVSTLPAFTGDSALVCGTEAEERTVKLCAWVKYNANSSCGNTLYGGDIEYKANIDIIYDTKPPTPPTLGELVVQDTKLVVPYTVDGETTTLRAIARRTGGADGGLEETVNVSGIAVDTSNRLTIEGLQNDVEYQVTLKGSDSAGNESAESSIAYGTPIKTYGFWDAYRKAGGGSQGGCDASGGGLTLLALLFMGRFFRRVSK